MDTGANARLEILKHDAELKILGPLRTHGWKVAVERENASGDGHIIYEAERGEHCRTFALLYSSASGNGTYRALEARGGDRILVNGDLWKIESYAHGIATPISSANDFVEVLIGWNRATSGGKFAPGSEEAESDEEEDPSQRRVLLSDTPIEAVWLRLRQLHSVRLAANQIRRSSERANVTLDGNTVQSKAEGVAYALRNATDYFSASQTRNVSQRVLNLYYGSMAFAFAEMLASPAGPTSLVQIEEETKRGHGLYTVDGQTSDVADLVVGLMRRGFFTSYLTFLGKDIAWTPKEKAKGYADLASYHPDSHATLGQLFARIPEIADLFLDVLDNPTLWLHPSYDTMANHAGFTLYGRPRVTRSYGILTDVSGKLSIEDVANIPGPISELKRIASKGRGARYRMAIDHEGHDVWWSALPLHKSPLGPVALIKPLYNDVSEYRAICLALLYALSIVVRYRPSVWRRVQEGDLDHMRVLIEAFLAAAERILPEQYLALASGMSIHARQPGSIL
jgi:hypothetical protein